MTRSSSMLAAAEAGDGSAYDAYLLTVCLMDLLHTKAGSGRAGCGRKNRPALSATSSQTDTLSSGKARRLLQSRIIRKHTDERAQAAGNGARVWLMLLGVLWGDVMVVVMGEARAREAACTTTHSFISARNSTGLGCGGKGAARLNVTASRALTPVLRGDKVGGKSIDGSIVYCIRLCCSITPPV
jgi:hypothetical protein